MINDKRILILAGISDTSAIVYNYLKDKYSIVGVVVEETKPLKQRISAKIRFIKRRIRILGSLTIFGQLLFSLIVDYPLRRFSKNRKNEILEANNLSIDPFDEAVLFKVKQFNSQETVDIIHRLQPDIIVVNGTTILRSIILDSTSTPLINIHLGMTPMYRGVHGMYWALVNDDRENAGVTVHFIDKGVDTGKIICQSMVTHTRKDNFATYPYLQISQGVKNLSKAIEMIISGNVENCKIKGSSKQYYHPTILQYLKNRILKAVK